MGICAIQWFWVMGSMCTCSRRDYGNIWVLEFGFLVYAGYCAAKHFGWKSWWFSLDEWRIVFVYKYESLESWWLGWLIYSRVPLQKNGKLSSRIQYLVCWIPNSRRNMFFGDNMVDLLWNPVNADERSLYVFLMVGVCGLLCDHKILTFDDVWVWGLWLIFDCWILVSTSKYFVLFFCSWMIPVYQYIYWYIGVLADDYFIQCGIETLDRMWTIKTMIRVEGKKECTRTTSDRYVICGAQHG